MKSDMMVSGLFKLFVSYGKLLWFLVDQLMMIFEVLYKIVVAVGD